MKERYKTIVLGATYYGLGYASSHEDCLILEESQTLGGDFHNCLHPVWIDETVCADSSELGQIMREYGVWTAEHFDLLKAQAVVHEYAARKLDQGMDILLDARIMEVRQEEGGTAVTFITNEGIATVHADALIDTTVDCISQPEAVMCTAKSLNAFTVAMSEDFSRKMRKACPSCCVLDGPLENEKLIQLCCRTDMSLTDAYQNLMDWWQKAFPEGEERILFVAETFDARYEAKAEKPAAWVGQRFSNPMAAFWKGAMA